MSGDAPAIVILGPTASGKTRLALALALQFKGEIVSCDALQVYRFMDIGTAKVSIEEQKMVRHHMIDVQDPDRDFSAGDYLRMAREAVCGIHERGHVPFVAGGTGFYLRALIEGLFEGPGRSEEIRARMRKIIDRKGAGILHRALKKTDPESAARISEKDAERILRAYEVFLLTGKTMAWWQRQPRDSFTGFRWLKIGIDIPREQLYQRINDRVDEMFRAGFLEEVRGLLRRFPGPSQAFKAIGYRQAVAHLEGRLSELEAIGEIKKESRHYAKRQLTWFRSDSSIVWLDGQLGPVGLERAAAELIGKWLVGSSQ